MRCGDAPRDARCSVGSRQAKAAQMQREDTAALRCQLAVARVGQKMYKDLLTLEHDEKRKILQHVVTLQLLYEKATHDMTETSARLGVAEATILAASRSVTAAENQSPEGQEDDSAGALQTVTPSRSSRVRKCSTCSERDSEGSKWQRDARLRPSPFSGSYM